MKNFITLASAVILIVIFSASIKLAFYPEPIHDKVEKVEKNLTMHFDEAELNLLVTKNDISEIKATIDSIITKLEALEEKRNARE
jgi:hypothetical protein